jgi:hypothetical protein
MNHDAETTEESAFKMRNIHENKNGLRLDAFCLALVELGNV